MENWIIGVNHSGSIHESCQTSVVDISVTSVNKSQLLLTFRCTTSK